MKKNKKASLKVLHRLKESKKIRESMREDFYDWYDSLTDYAQRRFDDYLADEGYPDMITDLSNYDIEYLMMEFNPDYFEEYDESTKRKGRKYAKKLHESASSRVEDYIRELASKNDNFIDELTTDEVEDALDAGADFDEILELYASEAVYRVLGAYEKNDYKEYNAAIDAAKDLIVKLNSDMSESKKSKKSCRECDKTIKEGKLRPFTKEDWYAWAGAEDFEDSPPYIYEDPESGNTIIVSGNSGSSEAIVEVDIWKDNDQSVSFYKEDYNSKDEALADAEDIIATGGLSGDLAYFDSRNGWTRNDMGI